MGYIWEYSLVERKGLDQGSSFGIHEIYYSPSDGDKVSYAFCGYTKDPIFGEFESIKKLRAYLVSLLSQNDLGDFPGNHQDVMKMLAAMENVVMDYTDFPPGVARIIAPSSNPYDPMAMRVVWLKD